MAGLVRLCPSVCASSHFAVLLGAYGASLSILGELWGPGRGTPENVGTRVWDPGGCGDQGVGPRNVRTGWCDLSPQGPEGGTQECEDRAV